MFTRHTNIGARRPSLLRRCAAGLVLALSTTLVLTVQPAVAAGPTIGDAIAVDAPKGEKGGVLSAYTACANWRVTPRNRWTLTNLETDRKRTFEWRGSGPSWRFPRMAVGDYRSRAVVRCRGVKRVRVQRLEIDQKTAEGTVSRPEWRQVRRGMTKKRVHRLLGNSGRDPWTWDGKTTRTYDMMRFWRWSTISYEDGRVVAKYWNVDHD